MENVIHLLPGEKLYFEQKGAMGFLKSGSVDLYAVTADHRERMFLLQRDQGQYFFGLFDEFQSVELFAVAKSPAVIEFFRQTLWQRMKFPQVFSARPCRIGSRVCLSMAGSAFLPCATMNTWAVGAGRIFCRTRKTALCGRCFWSMKALSRCFYAGNSIP